MGATAAAQGGGTGKRRRRGLPDRHPPVFIRRRHTAAVPYSGARTRLPCTVRTLRRRAALSGGRRHGSSGARAALSGTCRNVPRTLAAYRVPWRCRQPRAHERCGPRGAVPAPARPRLLRRRPRGGVAAGRPAGDGAGGLPGDCHRGRQRVRARALAGRRHARRHRAAQRRHGTVMAPPSQPPRRHTHRSKGPAAAELR